MEKYCGDAVDTVIGCSSILKNAVGIVGIIIVIGICILPIVKLLILMVMYKITAAIAEPIADAKIVGVIEQMADTFKVLLAILCTIATILIIGIGLVIKISNMGMMYR